MEVEVIDGDLCDYAGLMHAVNSHKTDCIAHLAAQAGVRYSLHHPHSYVKSNLEGFLNVLEVCRHVKLKLVYASSSSVYGMNAKVPFSESDGCDQPVCLYAATKKSNELMAYTYHHLFGIPMAGLRFFTVYGDFGEDLIWPTFPLRKLSWKASL